MQARDLVGGELELLLDARVVDETAHEGGSAPGSATVHDDRRGGEGRGGGAQNGEDGEDDGGLSDLHGDLQGSSFPSHHWTRPAADRFSRSLPSCTSTIILSSRSSTAPRRSTT